MVGSYAHVVATDANSFHQGSMGVMYGAQTANGQGTWFIEPRMVATPSAFVVAPTGNVGVGITAPNAKLQIMDSIAGLTTGLQVKPYHVPGVVAGTILDTADADGTVRSLSLQNNGGYVGIGTTTPSDKLDVVGGGIRLYGKDAFQGQDSWLRLRLNQSGSFTSGTHTPRNFNASGITTGALYEDPGAGNLKVSGNVGVGLAFGESATARLDVRGTILPGAQTQDAGCGPLGAQGYNSSTGAPLYCASSGRWTPVGGGAAAVAAALWLLRLIQVKIIIVLPDTICETSFSLEVIKIMLLPSGRRLRVVRYKNQYW